MKKDVYRIKNVLVSNEMNVVMKDNIYINKLTRIKELVTSHYPKLYNKHILQSILQKDLNIRRIVNWPLLLAELDEIGELDNKVFKS